MQVSVESGEGLQKRLLINVPAEQVNTAIDGKLKELSHSARMDGFRPGKVPMRVLKQRYGEQVKHDVYGEMIQSTFYQAASQENLMPVGPMPGPWVARTVFHSIPFSRQYCDKWSGCPQHPLS